MYGQAKRLREISIISVTTYWKSMSIGLNGMLGEAMKEIHWF